MRTDSQATVNVLRTQKIAELKSKLQVAWIRGKEQRIEIGTLLLQLRVQAEHGEWGILLAELGIPASTASDYMIEADRQFHESRRFDPQPDAEAKEMEQAVEAATALVNGQRPSDDPPPPIPFAQPRVEPNPQLEMHNRVRGPVLYCTAEQKEVFQAVKRENKERVYEMFYDALMNVICEKLEEETNETLAA
jgi:hypothetical protein